MRKKTAGEVSSFIVFFCILTFIIQSALYYFIESDLIILSASGLTSLLFSHILLEKTMNYETCFFYSLFMVFLSTVVVGLLYMNQGISFVPFSYSLFLLVLINWLVPCLYCFIRCMFDYGPRHQDYRKFYRNMSILFFLFYIAAFVYYFFLNLSYQETNFSRNILPYIPFMGIASYIEDYIYGKVELREIITYLLVRILFYIPFGYNIKLLFRKYGKLVKLLFLILFPVLVEALQYFIFGAYMSICDVIYGLFGGFLGILLFMIQNVIFRFINGKNFLEKEHTSSFYKNTLYY